MVIIFDIIMNGLGDLLSVDPVTVQLSHSITVPSKQDRTYPVSLWVMDTGGSDPQMWWCDIENERFKRQKGGITTAEISVLIDPSLLKLGWELKQLISSIQRCT